MAAPVQPPAGERLVRLARRLQLARAPAVERAQRQGSAVKQVERRGLQVRRQAQVPLAMLQLVAADPRRAAHRR